MESVDIFAPMKIRKIPLIIQLTLTAMFIWGFFTHTLPIIFTSLNLIFIKNMYEIHRNRQIGIEQFFLTVIKKSTEPKTFYVFSSFRFISMSVMWVFTNYVLYFMFTMIGLNSNR